MIQQLRERGLYEEILCDYPCVGDGVLADFQHAHSRFRRVHVHPEDRFRDLVAVIGFERNIFLFKDACAENK